MNFKPTKLKTVISFVPSITIACFEYYLAKICSVAYCHISVAKVLVESIFIGLGALTLIYGIWSVCQKGTDQISHSKKMGSILLIIIFAGIFFYLSYFLAFKVYSLNV